MLEKAIEAGFRMAGVGLGAIAMEWIETESEIGGKKRKYFEASKNGPAEEMSAAPPVFHQSLFCNVFVT